MTINEDGHVPGGGLDPDAEFPDARERQEPWEGGEPAPPAQDADTDADGDRDEPPMEEDGEPGADLPPKMGLLEWVEEVFTPMIQRRVDLGRGQTWCARWWEHPEVAVRLNALRLAWYELSAPAEPGGDPGAAYSSWFVNHVDPTLMTLLNGDTGPMSGCRPDRHSDTPVPSLRTERPPGRSEQQ
jgi:hypothetical protein